MYIWTAYSHGDSGYPCKAWFTGRTWLGGIVPNYLWFSNQFWYTLSIVTYSGATGGGASIKAFVVSVP